MTEQVPNEKNSNSELTSQTKNNSTKNQSSSTKESIGILSVLQSVLAAMFGVQSEEKRQKDFENGHAGNYIFLGIVMVLVFIFSLIKVVDIILENSK